MGWKRGGHQFQGESTLSALESDLHLVEHASKLFCLVAVALEAAPRPSWDSAAYLGDPVRAFKLQDMLSGLPREIGRSPRSASPEQERHDWGGTAGSWRGSGRLSLSLFVETVASRHNPPSHIGRLKALPEARFVIRLLCFQGAPPKMTSCK